MRKATSILLDEESEAFIGEQIAEEFDLDEILQAVRATAGTLALKTAAA